MKRYCKDVDILDRDLVSQAVYACLKDKYKRKDTLRLLSFYSDIKPRTLRNMISREGKTCVIWIVEIIIDSIIVEMQNKKLVFKDIHYVQKYDSSCLKLRDIGIQDVKQQLYDYVAVYALRPILTRIGKYQCAALPGKGQLYGVKAIHKWLKTDYTGTRWCAKCDIRKCYPSITKENMMGFLSKYIKNDDLLWLLDNLLSTFKQGLSIGSYLSQYLCNLYLSQLYHKMTEEAFYTRRNVRHNLCSHVLFYADDILILGECQSRMKKAMRFLVKEAGELGLLIKPDYSIYEITKTNCVDMMGFRIYRNRITLRSRIYLKVRRTFSKLYKTIKTHKRVSFSLAKRACSYIGLIVNTCRSVFKSLKGYFKVTRIVRRVVSYESRICRTAD